MRPDVEESTTASVVVGSDEGKGIRNDRASYNDDMTLVRLGKKPVLKRTFGFLPSLGFSCSLLVTWEGVNILLTTGLNNGGMAGLVYGYIVIWLGTISVFACLSELVSMAPVSSGQYHWVALLAPKSSQQYLSYMTGWFTVTGWLANAATATFLSGTLLQSLIALCHPDYSPQGWQGTLLCWAVILFCVLINTVVSTALPKFEAFVLIFHVVGFFGILIPLVVLGPHGSATDVFTLFNNGGNWPTQGLSFFVGLLGNVYAFFGADGAIHMCEEIHNAAMIVPKSMITAVLLNGILGFAMLIGLLFCLGNLEDALKPQILFPYVEIFHQAVRSTAGTAVMAAFISIMAVCASVAIVASSSRILWAFSRDRGVPGWKLWSTTDKRTSIPVAAVIVTTTSSCLLALINIGSTTAFNDIAGLTVSAIYTSYLIAIFLLLWRRFRGDIMNPDRSPADSESMLIWGPWRIPGVLGILNNIFACAFLLIIWFFAFWPPATPVVASTMNYNVLMLGSVCLLSTVYYFVWARKVYTGPIMEID